MNSNKLIEILYSTVSNKLGHIQARTAVLSAIGNILHDLKDENLEISEKNISEKLHKYVQDFQEATKSDVA